MCVCVCPQISRALHVFSKSGSIYVSRLLKLQALRPNNTKITTISHMSNICLQPDLHTLWVKDNDHVLMEDEEDIDWATAVVPAAEGEVHVDK